MYTFSDARKKSMGLILVILFTNIIFFSTISYVILSESNDQDVELHKENGNFLSTMTFDSQLINYGVIRKVSNYNYVTNSLYYIKYWDWSWASNTNKYLTNIRFPDNLEDGCVLEFYGKYKGSSQSLPWHIAITAPNDPSTVYGTFLFQSSNWQWFNITLNLPSPTNEFDIIINPHAKRHSRLYINFVNAKCEDVTDIGWHDLEGFKINNYTLSVWYNVTATDDVNSSNVWMELSANATYLFTNLTIWKSSFIIDELFQVQSLNTTYQWDSHDINLPKGPPSNGENEIIILIDFHVEIFGSVDNTFDEWLYYYRDYPMLRNTTIYWYY